MSMPKELTREELIRLGVTDITKDGRVFINGHERSLSILSKKHKYGKECKYKALPVYDPEVYRYQVATQKRIRNGIRIMIVSRMMYAWYHGVADEYMDVDHINGNSLDDRIENLQLLSRKDNLAKRAGERNQWKFIKESKENENKN